MVKLKKSVNLRRPIAVIHCLFYLCLFGIQACGHHLYHRAETGETVYSISWQYGYDYRKIAQWNELKAPYSIKQGQIIRLVPPEPEKKRTLFAHTTVQKTEQNRSSPQPAPVHVKEPSQIKPVVSNKQPSTKKIALEKTKIINTNHWLWPIVGDVVSQYGSSNGQFQGIHISGRLGAPVKAAAAGEVVYSGNGLKAYGNLIIIKHAKEYLSAYAFNRDIYVSEGDVVKRGQQIAELGRIDDELTALYFEIRKKGEPVDPLMILP
ncbi:MAG: peptidoglycan DD-metalloendopeptidase family protein [Gammaproteobacteria bacterium]|nr:peptidoglycan DD-metalloendopeptidase family protein [Gammaproteobacteria bacterium]